MSGGCLRSRDNGDHNYHIFNFIDFMLFLEWVSVLYQVTASQIPSKTLENVESNIIN